MRMIYLDESARGDRFYFFGALIADAAAVRQIEHDIDSIASLLARNNPGFNPETEFHAVDMFHGKEAWQKLPIGWRVKACNLTAKALARSSARFVFRGLDVRAHKEKYLRPFPVHLLTLAHVLERVDDVLGKLDGAGIGVVHADDHHSAKDARRSLRGFRFVSTPGYTTRQLHRIADTIYFGPSHHSRLLQAADFATFFLNRVRTVRESDARAATEVKKIAANIRSITDHEYVWSP